VQRVKSRAKRKAAFNAQEEKEGSKRTAARAGKHILAWLAAECLALPYGEQIVDRARELLVAADINGSLPKKDAPAGMPLKEIISRLKQEMPGEIFVETYGVWRARWLFFAFPDGSIAYDALDVAWAHRRGSGFAVE